MTEGQHVQGQPLPPQPTPMTFRVFTTPVGQDLVVLEVHHAAGTFIAFLDPESAKGMAAQLEQAAGSARSGLTVVQRGGIEPQIKGRG